MSISQGPEAVGIAPRCSERRSSSDLCGHHPLDFDVAFGPVNRRWTYSRESVSRPADGSGRGSVDFSNSLEGPRYPTSCTRVAPSINSRGLPSAQARAEREMAPVVTRNPLSAPTCTKVP